jgi:hypothetical protein
LSYSRAIFPGGSIFLGFVVKKSHPQIKVKLRWRAAGCLTIERGSDRGMAKVKRMKIGYARVSTIEQNMNLPRDVLKAAGCKKIIEDTVSGCPEISCLIPLP